MQPRWILGGDATASAGVAPDREARRASPVADRAVTGGALLLAAVAALPGPLSRARMCVQAILDRRLRPAGARSWDGNGAASDIASPTDGDERGLIALGTGAGEQGIALERRDYHVYAMGSVGAGQNAL